MCQKVIVWPEDPRRNIRQKAAIHHDEFTQPHLQTLPSNALTDQKKIKNKNMIYKNKAS
jgi:hypothetical protein